MYAKSAQPAGPAGERAYVGARESVRGRMRRVCVRARQTQQILTATDFLSVSHREKGEIERLSDAASSTIPYAKLYSNK